MPTLQGLLGYLTEGGAPVRNALKGLYALVTIYRGVPENVDKINPGDWVTLSKKAAEDYTDPIVIGGNKKGKVLQMQVPAKSVTSWPDALLENGYFPL